ncbi:MAG: hypothetical protein NUV92_02780 [Ignavibacteria bacterium]|jgi:hypothetical protein|nr:hypothetical protein [Ignavibacteria bacterium]MDH7527158.1 hypothetical protein [Ignavibacteria bacterium]
MNSSQLIILIASLILLSTIIILTNRANIETKDEKIEARNLYHAVNEAKNLFEEMRSKIFDEKFISMTSINRDSLTNISMLGPDNEIYPEYDDIDDYNGYSRELNLENNKFYTLQVTVNYVREDNPDIISSSPTFYKLVTIKCFGQNQAKKFELKQIFSVW